MSKIILPTLESERLILRPLTLDDYQAVFKCTGDPRVNKYMIYPPKGEMFVISAILVLVKVAVPMFIYYLQVFIYQ